MSPYQKIKKNGFSVTSYAGDGAVLLAFDMDDDKIESLAGFAIKAVTPDKGPYKTNEYWLKNRLGFKEDAGGGNGSPDKYYDSNQAPFQTFHWVHFPGAGPGQYKYTAYPCYFEDGGKLKLGAGISSNVNLGPQCFVGMEVGFTRGYISSQAYVDRFNNAPIGPEEKTIDFDTTLYGAQYEWLGAHARKLLFDFLNECRLDPSVDVDVFTFDFNEPDMIKQLAAMGPRVRLIQDDSESHKKADALELDAIKALGDQGVAIKTGHFANLSHDKVIIKKIDGKAVKVLTGSANFSLRGLYVQANSVLVFDDEAIAGHYEDAFEQAFNDMKHYKASGVSRQWFDEKTNNASPISFSFAPHSKAFTLDMLSEAIDSAKSSVFFAIMEASGGGSVMQALQNMGEREGIYTVGVIEERKQIDLFKQGPNESMAMTSKAFLKKNVPEPFKQEWDGGFGKVIHHKFLVCDFNTPNPVVFCGSSNLSEGGETRNGDNLIAIRDPDIAGFYAIEAIRLYDHYRFRSSQENSDDNTPLALDSTNGWTKRYYDKNSLKFNERILYAGT